MRIWLIYRRQVARRQYKQIIKVWVSKKKEMKKQTMKWNDRLYTEWESKICVRTLSWLPQMNDEQIVELDR